MFVVSDMHFPMGAERERERANSVRINATEIKVTDVCFDDGKKIPIHQLGIHMYIYLHVVYLITLSVAQIFCYLCLRLHSFKW